MPVNTFHVTLIHIDTTTSQQHLNSQRVRTDNDNSSYISCESYHETYMYYAIKYDLIISLMNK